MEVGMKYLLRIIGAIALALAAPLAGASFHTFVLEQLYSNADGTVQFIVLHEAFGAGGEQFLQGHQLTVSHNGALKTLTFDHALANGSTAGKRALIATQGFAALGVVTPDYVVPNG